MHACMNTCIRATCIHAYSTHSAALKQEPKSMPVQYDILQVCVEREWHLMLSAFLVDDLNHICGILVVCVPLQTCLVSCRRRLHMYMYTYMCVPGRGGGCHSLRASPVKRRTGISRCDTRFYLQRSRLPAPDFICLRVKLADPDSQIAAFMLEPLRLDRRRLEIFRHGWGHDRVED